MFDLAAPRARLSATTLDEVPEPFEVASDLAAVLADRNAQLLGHALPAPNRAEA